MIRRLLAAAFFPFLIVGTVYPILYLHKKALTRHKAASEPSLSKKSGWSWAFSDRYGRMDKGDERYWNAGKWIEIW